MPPFTFEEALEPEKPKVEGSSFEEAQDDPLTGELGVFQNRDGSRSTEVSITEEFDGRFFNFPSLVKGQVNPEAIANGERLTDEQFRIAVERFQERGGFESQAGFETLDEAVEAAKSRSDAGASTEKFSSPETFSFEEATPTPTPAEKGLGFNDFLDELNRVDPSVGGLIGIGETGLQMMTGFAGALPATILGLSRAIIEDDINVFPERFQEIQEKLTFNPRTNKGKQISEGVAGVLQKYSEFVDRKLVEPSLQPGREDPLVATIGKVSGEALPLLLPMVRVGKGRVPKPAEEPITKPAPAEIDPTLQAPALALRRERPRDFTFEEAVETVEPVTPVEALRPAKGEPVPEGVRPPPGELEIPVEPSTVKDVAELPRPEPFPTDPTLGDPTLAFRRGREFIPRAEEPIIPKGQTPAAKAARAKAIRLDPQKDSLFTAIGKLGGIDKNEMMRTFGLDPKDTFNSGVIGKPVLRTKEGLDIDTMMEALAEENYLKLDESGRVDPREFEEKFFEENFGNKQFSASQDIETRFDFNSEYENFVNSESYKLNVGIPVEEISASLKKANESRKDILGIPEKGVEVLKPEIAKQPGIITPFQSPRTVAKKFPSFAPIKKLADRSMIVQDKLRSIFAKRLDHVDSLLKPKQGGFFAKRKKFKENKALLDNILLQGDMLGKDFSQAELKSSGVPDNVISGYNAIRSAYNKALSIANKTRELRGKLAINKRTGYIPHFFHNWFVSVDGQLVSSARTMREAVAMGNDAARGGGQVKIFPKQFEFPQEKTQAAVVGDLDFFKVQKNLEETFSMTPKEAGDLLSNFARLKGRSRFIGNFLERKGAEGYEKNLAYVHRHYFNMISRFAALDGFKSKSISMFERQHGNIDKQHSGIAQYTKNYINDINGVPTPVENLLNSTLANTPGLSKFLGKHLGDRPSLEIASMTTNAIAIAKLGLYNVSSALVNGSQFMMSNALLGPKWTAEGIKRAGRLSGAKIGEKLGAAHKANPDRGILNQLGIGLQQGLESGAGYSKFNQMGRLFSKSTAIFQGVEWQLRASTALGAYHKGLSNGMTKPQALEFAQDINFKANFNYSIADTPSFIRRTGPLGQVLFQFKKFPIKAMEFMAELKGAENARFWIPFVAVSGYYGFPGMEGIKNMVRRLFDVDIELESKEFFIRWAGDDPEKLAIVSTIMYGAFSNEQLGGVDISRRIGASDFIPSEGRDLLGPALSTIIRATQMAAQEEWVETLRAVATAPGNIAIALRNDGELTSPWDRGRLTTKLDTKGRILKGLGFTTIQESRERDVTRILRKNARKAREEEQKAIDGFIKIMKGGDDEKIGEALKELGELGVSAQRIKNEIGKKGLTRSFRAFLNLSKKRKAADLELLKFTEP